MSIGFITEPDVDKLLREWNDKPLYGITPSSPPFRYSKFSLFVDHYCPILSAIFNIYYAIDKSFHVSSDWDGTLLPAFQPLTRESKGYWRHVVVSIPVIGNIIIALYDRHAKTMAENILKDIPKGTSLNDKHIVALRQAAGYGSAEAMVRLAQHYIWNVHPEDMQERGYIQVNPFHFSLRTSLDLPVPLWRSFANLLRGWLHRAPRIEAKSTFPNERELPKDTVHFLLVLYLYAEASWHAYPEAQEWDAKWEQIFIELVGLKRYIPTLENQSTAAAWGCAILIAEQWTPEMQTKLPVFETISSLCLKNPTKQKIEILKKFCEKVERSGTCNISTARAAIQAFESH